MNQKNPLFEDNVNVSKTSPLADFLWLGGGAILIVVSLTIIFYASMQWIAPYIPFSFEQKLVSNINITEAMDESDVPNLKERVQYLQNLANDLAKAQGLNKDITITVHWMDDDMVNAFAGLGGHIFITKGLWDAMPSENALAMVIAHEIAHVNHRDPLKGLGAGVALSLLSTIVFGASDTGMSLVGSSGVLTSLHFSRSMESQADEAALQTLQNHYGHVTGATDFFEDILNEESFNIKFLQTHPLTQDRIDRLLELQKQNNWVKKNNEVNLLPNY